jgi:hypothetical protein
MCCGCSFYCLNVLGVPSAVQIESGTCYCGLWGVQAVCVVCVGYVWLLLCGQQHECGLVLFWNKYEFKATCSRNTVTNGPTYSMLTQPLHAAPHTNSTECSLLCHLCAA